MTIKNIKSKKGPWQDNEIDLTGPNGNVFCLMGIARGVCQYNGIDGKHIVKGMKKAKSYDEALQVFDFWLGDTFILYRR